MTKSRVVLAIEAAQLSAESSQISQLSLSQPGGGVSIGMTSQLIVAAISKDRLVEITNLAGGVAAVFFNFDVDAVAGEGTALLAGQAKVIPLQSGKSLNGVATTAGVNVSFQVYG